MNAKTLTALLAGALVTAGWLWPTEGLTVSVDANKIYLPRGGDERQRLPKNPGGWEAIRDVYAPIGGIADWQKLVEQRQKSHWKPGKSAHATGHSWFNANPELPREINALLGGAELLAATPEHETPLAGRGTGSVSDVLAFVNMRGARCAVTVEGKVDEKFGDTVEAWLKKASTEGSRNNRTKRLNGIYDELGLTNPDAAQIRYQLLHRAAAAVIEAKRFNADCAAMIVQSFSPQHQWFGDFAEFLKLFGINSVKRDTLYETDMPGMPLYFGWTSPAGTVASAPVSTKTVASSTEAVVSAPLSQFIIGGVIVFVALVVGCFVVRFMQRRSGSNDEKSSEIDATAAAVADEDDPDGAGKAHLHRTEGVASFVADEDDLDGAGKAFENYVKDLLCGRENVKLTKPTDKFDYPDFEMTIRDKKRRIFLECKWTKSFYQGNYDVVRDPKQLQKYKDYQKEYGQPFFVVLGVGGAGEKPNYLYAIPLEALPKTKLNYEQLKDYLQKEGSDYGYKPSTNRLTISR